MMLRGMLLLAGALGLPLATLGQTAKAVPAPRDPLELVTGPAETLDTTQAKEAADRLLARARDAYTMRSAGRAFELKVTFTVNSGGQTQHDGIWEMDEIFSPAHGRWWTVKAVAQPVGRLLWMRREDG
jgi:hypothetical protein